MSNRLIVICLVLLGLYFANAQQDNAMPVQQAQQISREANKSPITVAPGAAKPGKGILGKIKINGNNVSYFVSKLGNGPESNIAMYHKPRRALHLNIDYPVKLS